MRRGIKTAFFAAAIILTAMLCVQGCKGQAVQTEAAESKAEATKRNAGTAGYGTAGVENGAEAVKNEAETTKEGLQTPSGGAAAKGQTPAGTASEPSAGAPAGGVEAKTASAPANEGAGDPAPPEETAGNPGKTALASPSVTGALRVEGAGLVGSGGEAVQLRGISTHGLAWFPDYVNEACFRELREDWQANVIRLALYTAEYGGYCSGGDREYLKGLVEAGVEYAAQADLYVIIDWHILSDGNPNTHLAEAKEFFGEMSARYADREHVLYEICNEPNGGTAWPEIKSYAEEVIGVIRENDTDAVILVGTPNWSQYVDQAAADPLSGYENVMYTLHFYAATHKEDLRERMTAAVEAGLPVFVSEFGVCDASGNGSIDEAQADAWVRQMDALGISYVAWNLSNKAETSALLASSCQKSSGFGPEDLSASGQWLYRVLAGEREPTGRPEAGAPEGGRQPDPEGGTDAPAGTKTGGEDPPPAVPSESVLTNGAIEITAVLVNSWEADGQPAYHYTLTLRNASQSECTGWAVDVGFTGDITLLDGWNGDYRADGSTLHITSKDYNGRLGAGAAAADVGFIVSGGSIAP